MKVIIDGVEYAPKVEIRATSRDTVGSLLARTKLLEHNLSVVCEENVSAGKTVVNLSLKIAELERENKRLRAELEGLIK